MGMRIEKSKAITLVSLMNPRETMMEKHDGIIHYARLLTPQKTDKEENLWERRWFQNRYSVSLSLSIYWFRHVEGRRRKKRKSTANENQNGEILPSPPGQNIPELGDGWTNVEWTILEHTHDHIRSLGAEAPESIDPTKLAEVFLKIYETSELKLKAEEEGKERKEFTKEEVRDRIIALRKTRDRRRSGELPPAGKLDSPASVRSRETAGRRLSGFLQMAKFWWI